MFLRKINQSIDTYLNVEIKPIHQYQAFHLYQHHLISTHDQVHYSAMNNQIDFLKSDEKKLTSLDLTISCLAVAPVILPFCGES